MQNKPEGVLYVVSTPIGNLEDITLRALRILKEVDLIAAEDTRRTRQLLTHYGIRTPLISYHEHNQKMREEPLMDKLREGKQVALVTDAGTPGISDPGTPLIHRAAKEGIALIPIPGPSAAITALSISGLPTESFLFHGFPPAKAAARQKFLEALKNRPETLLFYESPRRLIALLQDALKILGNREVVVMREATKLFEEALRGKIRDVLEKIGGKEVKGEITVIFEGNREEEAVPIAAIRTVLENYILNSRVSMKEAVERVAQDLGVAKREVYQESLRLKRERAEGEE